MVFKRTLKALPEPHTSWEESKPSQTQEQWPRTGDSQREGYGKSEEMREGKKEREEQSNR